MAVQVRSIVIDPIAETGVTTHALFTANYRSTRVTFTFTEPVQNGSFTLDDVTGLAPGTSLSNLTRVDGRTWTATLTAAPGGSLPNGEPTGTATSTGEPVWSTGGLRVYHKDVNGYDGRPGPAFGANNYVESARYAIDTLRIYVTAIDLDNPSTRGNGMIRLYADETTTATFTFNKSPRAGSFGVEDIFLEHSYTTIVPGSLRSISADDRVWTATLRHNENVPSSSGGIRVYLPGLVDKNGTAGAVTANGSAYSRQTRPYIIDTQRPLLDTNADGATVSGNQLVLRYSLTLDATNKPDKASFAVLVNGVANAVTAVAVAGQTVTLTLTSAVRAGQAISVSYTDPTSGVNDRNAVQSAVGNDALSFAHRAVANNAPADTTPPVLSSATVNGDQLVLQYTEANRLDAGSIPGHGNFVVWVNGVHSAITHVTMDADAKTVTLTLARPVADGEGVTLSYITDPFASGLPATLQYIRDESGNQAALFQSRLVTNNTPDTTAPLLVTQGDNAPQVNDRQLVLHYTDTNRLSTTVPASTAFTLRVDGVVVNNAVIGDVVNPVSKTVTLTLATAVTHGQVVTVSYTAPGTANDDNAIQDAVGNDAASFTNQPVANNTPDTAVPQLVTTGADAPAVNGHQLVLHYSDTSRLGTAGPAATAFTLRVDGVVVNNGVTGAAVNPVAKTVTLTLATAVAPGQGVAVSYTDPSGNNDDNAIQDAVGNDAASFTNQPVANNTPDIAAPLLVTTGDNAPQVNGSQLVLHYTDANNLSAAGPAATAFRLRVDGLAVNHAVTGAVVNPAAKTITLTLATAVAHGQTVAVSYADPGGNNDANDANAIQDAAGNDAASFTNQPVANNTPDTTAPLLVTTGDNAPAVNDRQLVLHYTDASDLGISTVGPAATAFTLRVNGAVVNNAVTGAVVNPAAKTITLTLATAVAHGQTVTVSYTDPTPDRDDSNAIQDAAGNDAVSFTNQPVANNTPDTTAPVLITTGDSAPWVNGRELVLHYDDTSNLSPLGPQSRKFRVRVNDVFVYSGVTDVVVNPAAKTVTLTLGAAVRPGQRVALSYTDPSGNNDRLAIQDAAGNDAASFTDQSVANNTTTPDAAAPLLVTTGDNAPWVNGRELVLHYIDANRLSATGPDSTAFTLRVDGAVVNNAITGAVVNPAAKTVTLTLATAVAHGQTVTVSYTDPTPDRDDNNAIQDAAGNDAASFTNQSVANNTPDTTAPVLLTTGPNAPQVNGTQLVLHYDDANDLGGGVNAPLPGAFTVQVDNVANSVASANVTGKAVTLTLATAVNAGQRVSVGYRDPTIDNDTQAVQDTAGNDAVSFDNQPVTNNSPAAPTPTTPSTTDTTAPVLVTTGPNAPQVNGRELVLHYTDANNLSATGPDNTAFTLRVDGAVVNNAVTGAVVNPAAKTVTLTLATAVAHGQTVAVSYADPGGNNDNNDDNAIQDAASNDAASFTNQSVANNTPDTTAPVLVTTGPNAPTVNGTQLVLHYTDANNLSATGPDNTAFTLRVDGAVVNNAVTGAVVNPAAKTVTLTLATAVAHGQMVTVSYADPGGNDDNAIQDAAGNDAASFTNQSVANNTPDTTAPVLVTTGPNAPTVNGNQLVLHYTDASNLSTTGPDNTAFTLRIDGAVVNNAVTGAVVNSATKTVTLTLATAVTQGQMVTVSYTDLTPDLDDSNAIQDAAGNDAASFTNQPVTNNSPAAPTPTTPSTTDTTAPVLVTTGPNAPTVNGNQLVLHYTDASNLSPTGPDNTVFTLRIDGVDVNNAVTGAVVNPAAKTVTLTLATAVTQGQMVTVSYTDPTPDLDDSNAIQDVAGNDAISFDNQPVTNNSPAAPTPTTPTTTDTTAPVLVTTGPDAPTVNGNQLVLHYTDASNLSTTGPDNTAFTLRIDGAVVNNAITGAVVNSAAKTVTLTLATAVAHGQMVSVGYTDLTPDLDDSNAIQDAAGNDAASFTSQPVANNTPAAPTPTTPSTTDTTAPVLVTTGPDAPTVNGTQLVLHYTDANNLSATEPDNTAFTLRIDGVVVNNAITGAVVNPAAKTVTLTLAAAVTQGQMVTVSYTDPTPDLDDSNAIQDAAGNDAVSFDNQPVTNNSPAAPTPTTPTTTDTTAPVLVTTGPNAPTVNGNQLVLHYTDANNLSTVGPDNTAFTLRIDGVVVNNAATGAVVNSAAKTVTLTLATAVTHGQMVTVSYTDLTPDLDDSNAIQDAAGNDAISFDNQPVTNNSPAAPTPTTPSTTDTTAPVLITTGPNAPTVNGTQLVLHYTDANNLSATGPDNTAFTLRIDGVVVNDAITGAVVNPAAKTVTLTLATAVAHGQMVTVSYTDPTPDLDDSNAIQDAAGNDAVSFTNEPVENITAAPPPTTPTTEPSTTPTPTPTPTQAQTPTSTSTSGASSSGTSTASGSRAFDDNDCVPTAQEDQIPGLARPGGAAPMAGDGNGDGNGDGIKDSLQSAVASLNGVTLVVTDQNGKPLVETADVRISVMEQKAAPVHLPSGFEMPIGMLDFKVEPLVTAGSIGNFSLYVDPTRNINGYWVQDFTGAWVNLASEPYDGKVVIEGNRLRLDFKITDGGRFDADGKADGSIAVSGAAAHMPQLSIMGQAPDFAHGGVFWF